jgi:hypothetical protein
MLFHLAIEQEKNNNLLEKMANTADAKRIKTNKTRQE